MGQMGQIHQLISVVEVDAMCFLSAIPVDLGIWPTRGPDIGPSWTHFPGNKPVLMVKVRRCLRLNVTRHRGGEGMERDKVLQCQVPTAMSVGNLGTVQYGINAAGSQQGLGGMYLYAHILEYVVKL